MDLYSEDGDEIITSFFGHQALVETGTFQEEHLVTGSKDGTVRLFDMKTGEWSRSLTGDTRKIFVSSLDRL